MLVVVFCDTNPLQNYVVDLAKSKGVKTLSLQHGFYPDIDNKYWRRIFLASNSDIFAAWDLKTISLMNKFSFFDRDYLKVGPINIHEKVDYNKTNSKIESIAIYSVGKDQKDINNYLESFYKYLKVKGKWKVTFISHPGFNFLNRVLSSLKSNVHYKRNSHKKRNYDFHFVINSSIWLELEQNRERYLRLDNYFKNKIMFDEVLNSMTSFNSKKVYDKDLRVPFRSSKESINIITEFIMNYNL